MPDIRILERRTLSDYKSRLESIRFEKTQHGATLVQEKIVLHRPAAACILLYDAQRKTVMLTRQFRLPVYLDKREPILEVCAGLLKDGELPEHAIVREVEEETGFRISTIEKITEAYSSPSVFSEYMYFFAAKYSPDMRISEGGGLQEEGESIQVQEFTGSEIRTLIAKNAIRDMKSILLLQHAIIQALI